MSQTPRTGPRNALTGALKGERSGFNIYCAAEIFARFRRYCADNKLTYGEGLAELLKMAGAK